jgi:hypothetical protein
VFLGLGAVRTAEARAKTGGKFTLTPGDHVPPLAGIGLDDKALTINYADLNIPTAIYTVSPTCVWCARNQANLDALVEQQNDRYHVVIVSLTRIGLPAYIAGLKARWRQEVPVVAAFPTNLKEELYLGAAPETILISPKGIVLGNWIGAYTDASKAEIETRLDVKLPGLLPEQKPPDPSQCVDDSGGISTRGAVRITNGKREQCIGGKWVEAQR